MFHRAWRPYAAFLWLVIAATAAGCSPQFSSLGTLTTGAAGTAGVFGPWGGAAGSSGVLAGGLAGGAGAGLKIGPFGAPRVIPTLRSAGMVTTDPCVTGDSLTMYMMSTRGGNKDLWVSTRASVDEEWAVATPVTELNTDFSEQNCKISPDGRTLWFYSDRDRALGTLWETHRASNTAAWATPSVIPGICDSSASDVAPAMVATQLVVVFASLRSRVTQEYDLFEARRASTSVAFDAPALIEGVNSSASDYDPYLSPDGTLLVFHSTRLGNDDIFWARRANLDSPFSTPLALAEVNSTASDVAPAMVADGSTIWFASTRDGDEQLYEATVASK